MLLGAIAIGCAPELPIGDASVAPTDEASPLDALTDTAASGADSAEATATPTDAARDAMSGDDVDATATDVAATDVATTTDASSDDVRPGADAPTVDLPCTGAGPVVTVAAPTNEQVIETCSASGAAVFFDFVANVAGSSPIASVSARWITPDGAEAPPPATVSAAPYSFRRQVGGPSTGAPALGVFGVRGGWRVEFTAVDACGRRSAGSQSFSLTFTNRRCPNP